MNNNTGFTPTNASSSLFPPLIQDNSSTNNNDNLLWNNVNTFAIPDDSESSGSPKESNSSFGLQYSQSNNNNNSSINSLPQDNKTEDSTVFNISWGGDDKPPSELHPAKEEEEPIRLSRPLPKPRGIRKLPEPEPSEDGTIDEDTLKRRKVIISKAVTRLYISIFDIFDPLLKKKLSQT